MDKLKLMVILESILLMQDGVTEGELIFKYNLDKDLVAKGKEIFTQLNKSVIN